MTSEAVNPNTALPPPPPVIYVQYHVTVVRRVANVLSKGKTMAFMHQQYSALLRGAERQALALWVIQLKNGSSDEKQFMLWGRYYEEKH